MMGPLPEPRLPLDLRFPSSFASLLESLSATQAEGAWSLEISFLWNSSRSGSPKRSSWERICQSEWFVLGSTFL